MSKTYEELVNDPKIIRRSIVLTKAARLLSEQGRQAIKLSNLVCQYETEDGYHCAIGILLKDAGKPMPTVNLDICELSNVIQDIGLSSDEDIEFVAALQRAHDFCFSDDFGMMRAHDPEKDEPFYYYLRKYINDETVEYLFD